MRIRTAGRAKRLLGCVAITVGLLGAQAGVAHASTVETPTTSTGTYAIDKSDAISLQSGGPSSGPLLPPIVPIVGTDGTWSITIPVQAVGADATDSSSSSKTCKFSGAYGGYSAAYTDDTLTSLHNRYATSVTCTFGLEAMFSTAYLNKDGSTIATAPSDSCEDGNCTSTASGSTETCNGPGCSGTYNVDATNNLQLPPGLVWSYEPDECQSYSNGEDLACYFVSSNQSFPSMT